MMAIIARAWGYLLFITGTFLFLLGCGSTAGSFGGSGVGADGGPWPSSSNGYNIATRQTTETKAICSLTILLNATTAAEKILTLTPTKIELRYHEKNWDTLELKQLRSQPLPLRADEKGTLFLLSTTKVIPQKYTALRISFDKSSSLQVKKSASEDKSVKNIAEPVAIETMTCEFAEWIPDAKRMNVLTVVLDGKQITKTDTKSILPATAVTALPGIASGAVSGTLISTASSVNIDAYWGESKAPFAKTTMLAKDQKFTIPDLPAGVYHVKITANGYQLEKDIDPVTVKDTTVPLGNLNLVKKVE